MGSWFDGQVIGATTPKIGAGKYSELTVKELRIHEGQQAQGGTRFIAEFQVTGPVENTGEGDGRNVPYKASDIGETVSYSVRLDDGYGYGIGDVFAMLTAMLGKPCGKEEAYAAVQNNPHAGQKVAGKIWSHTTKGGHTVAKAQWVPTGQLTINPDAAPPTQPAAPAAAPTPPAPPAAPAAPTPPVAVLTAEQLGWTANPQDPNAVYAGQVSKWRKEVEEGQLRP